MRHFPVRAKFKIAIAGSIAIGGAAIAGVTGTAGAAPPSARPGPSVPAPPGGQSFLRQVADVTFPAPYTNTSSFDISWVDPKSQTYYLADRTNNGIDAIDAANNSFGSVIGAGAFTGSSAPTAACGTATAGPNGVLTLSVGGVNQLVGGDGVSVAQPISTLKVFTLSAPTSGKLAATIPTAVTANSTTGTCRVDEMAYDPVDQLLLAANDRDPTPYVSLVSMHSSPSLDTIVAQIKFPEAANGVGIEQSVYDSQTHLFYLNIPGVEVAVINPHSMAVTRTYPTPGCTASGLALDEQTQDLLLSCSVNPNGVEFMNARNGRIVATVPQVSGADEVWFDPGTDHYYLAASSMTSTGSAISTSPGSYGYVTPVIGVIASGPGKAATASPGGIQWVENVPEPTTEGSHSVAADPVNGDVLFPLKGAGIAVFAWTNG